MSVPAIHDFEGETIEIRSSRRAAASMSATARCESEARLRTRYPAACCPSRRMAAWPATQGHLVNRKRVRRLMQPLGVVAIYQRPNTSKPAAAHKIYPYLLSGLAIERVNQVWCSNITYIPMAQGFLYLVVVMDWVSRAVLAWRLSNTLGAEFCVEALEDTLSRYAARRRASRLANFGAVIEELGFARDSPLEGDRIRTLGPLAMVEFGAAGGGRRDRCGHREARNADPSRRRTRASDFRMPGAPFTWTKADLELEIGFRDFEGRARFSQSLAKPATPTH